MFPYVGGAKEIKLTYYVSHKAQNSPPKQTLVCFGGFSFPLLLHEADYLVAVEAPVTLA